MPGISVLPPASIAFSPSHSSSSAMQNGYSNNGETVADIKERAKERAFSVTKTKGISSTSLMRVAQESAFEAQKAEDSGDLKKSLGLWVQASSLLSALFDTADYKAEAQPGKRGALYKGVTEWMQSHAQDIINKTHSVESKLKDLENSGATSSSNPSGPKSIAGRIASLRNAGLSVASTKRVSQEITNGINVATQPLSSSSSLPPAALPSSPISPMPARPFNRLSLQTSVLTPTQPALTPVVSTPHALIPASSFGPPSPVSSTSDSPKTTPASSFGPSSVSEFQQYFPTIDELEEMENLRVTDSGYGSSTPQHPSLHTIPNGTSQPIPIPTPTKPFPALPFDFAQRPSSTPIPPTHDVLMGSRPSSPAAKPPLSPIVLRKPSNISLSSSTKPLLAPSTSLGNISSPGSSPRTDKQELPKLPKSTMCTSKELYDYMHNIGYGVLILDVRSREEFEVEHIKASAVVCLEPLVLKRENITGETIEDSLHVAPRHERTLFSNRDKFDVIVIADQSSETYPANPALPALVQAIYEIAFKKCLRHAPMLLVGGLDAWKREFGDGGVDRDVSSNGSPVPVLNGGISSSSSSSSMRYTSPPYVRNRSGTESSLSSSFTGRDLGTLNESPRLPLSTETSPGPLYTLPQPSGGINGFGSDSKLFDRHVVANGHPPSSNRTDPVTPGYINGTTSIQYPSYPKPAIMSTSSLSPPPPSTHTIHEPALPPVASINPYPFSRRRSDYPDQTQEALSTLSSRSVDYPDLSSSSLLRPPPVAAAPALERQENRPRLPHHAHSFSLTGPRPLMIQSDYPVTYWSNVQIGISGLKNLGNTCYMNSTIQCLSATVPFARFFTDGRWKSAVNMVNPLGTKGNLAHSFAMIVHEMWQAEMPYLTPLNFRKSICSHALQFSGSDQHDAQEFLSFLLDGLHEDLNRVLQKPQIQTTPEREAELERLPLQIASQQEWEAYKSRNDSLIVDFFQGQFRNKMECLTCHKTSTTYNPLMYLSLPIPPSHGGKVALQACLDALVNKEVMTGSEAWNCPNCKTLRQATKQLSLSRLPPVLMIHLKRFSFKGPFTDKIESFVDFPMKDLDLTGYMPYVDANLEAKLPPDDARAQIPPFKYDLYAVTNHFGSLSSGHYTAFISSRGGWVYCDDSRVTQVDAKEVVGKPAYILYYKRVKT
ncbi:cysteine proteinase [Thelephora ganbajun]|uniref:Cysteine proteinase n=1 Tax=Thelephora ganbajun TaxID=370292 RepID=A0ACB6ZGW3_THEGA|nr:cysteine proteinase [Thelephora ganbajun]